GAEICKGADGRFRCARCDEEGQYGIQAPARTSSAMAEFTHHLRLGNYTGKCKIGAEQYVASRGGKLLCGEPGWTISSVSKQPRCRHNGRFLPFLRTQGHHGPVLRNPSQIVYRHCHLASGIHGQSRDSFVPKRAQPVQVCGKNPRCFLCSGRVNSQRSVSAQTDGL